MFIKTKLLILVRGAKMGIIFSLSLTSLPDTYLSIPTCLTLPTYFSLPTLISLFLVHFYLNMISADPRADIGLVHANKVVEHLPKR